MTAHPLIASDAQKYRRTVSRETRRTLLVATFSTKRLREIPQPVANVDSRRATQITSIASPYE